MAQKIIIDFSYFQFLRLALTIFKLTPASAAWELPGSMATPGLTKFAKTILT